MENIYNCQDSFIVGEIGEEVTYKWFKHNPKIKEIYDTRKDKFYRDIDIDFIVKTTDDKKYNVEVKTDTYTTGRLCYELMSCVETGSLGCMRKSKADWLLYYFEKWDKMYMFNFPKYKAWCEEHLEDKGIRFPKKTQTNRYDGSQYTTDCVYFNLDELEKHDFCTKVYENFSKEVNNDR